MFAIDYRLDGVTHTVVTVRKRRRGRHAVCGVRVDGPDGRAMKRPAGPNPPHCEGCANGVAAVNDLMERWEV